MKKSIVGAIIIMILAGCNSSGTQNSATATANNLKRETRQVVAQNGNIYVLKTPEVSKDSYIYKDGDFYTKTTPPQVILPITITDNKSWGVNIPGIYAGKKVYLSRNGGKFIEIDLSNIKPGDTKIVK